MLSSFSMARLSVRLLRQVKVLAALASILRINVFMSTRQLPQIRFATYQGPFVMIDRRDFFRYSVLMTAPVSSAFPVVGCGGSGQVSMTRYAIASEVLTTLQNTVVPGPKPSVSIHLGEVARFKQYGFGNWTVGNALKAEIRTDLMPALFDATVIRKRAKLLNFFTITDIHVTDKEAPNQLIYLETVYESAVAVAASLYSPVMLCSTQVLDAAVQTINALHEKSPIDFGLSLGDVCNSAQYNELRWYIDVLDGKVITPSSGGHLGADSIDYQMPYQAAGLNKAIPWYQTLGNHDHFWMGSIPVDHSLRTDLRDSYTGSAVFATAKEMLYKPAAIQNRDFYMGVLDGASPYGDIKYAGPVANFQTPPQVVADPDRRALKRDEWLAEFFTTTSQPVGHGFNLADAKNGFACYSFVPKSTLPVKVIVLDNTQREDDGSTDIHGHGFLDAVRWTWLKAELAAGDQAGQLMIIAAHIPLAVEMPGTAMAWWDNPQNAVDLTGLLAELHSHPNLLLWLAGHRHSNTVKAFTGATSETGFWQVETSSLRDFPQQFRLFEIHLNSDYSVSIVTTNVDPAVREGTPAAKSRAYAVAAMQIVKGADDIENRNPTGDASIHRTPGGSYNAELLKRLSPAMVLKMQALYPSI
jgi:metallophosphoesterase (TIGR03768 family)